MTITEARARYNVRRIARRVGAAAASAALLLGLAAVPAQAHDAQVQNSSASQVRIAVHNETGGRWLYPGQSTTHTTDYVFVPAGTYVNHYYNKKFQRTYGPGSWIHTGGVYLHYFFAYRTP